MGCLELAVDPQKKRPDRRGADQANVRYMTRGGIVQPTVLEYLNRLSDVLWLCARAIEARHGVDAQLRDAAHPGAPW